jgi:Domain of unknown function (DUF4382)
MISYSFARLVGRAAVAALALVTLGALEACGGDSTAAGTTKVSVLLTDAPGDIKAAVVTISEIDLQGSGGNHVLLNSPVTADLLTLAHSTAQLVNDAVVPRGTYTQLRFVITGGYIEVENVGGGSSIFASSPDYSGLPVGAHVDGELKMPSFAQSGLKVDLPTGGTTLGSDSKVYLVDFNVAQSFGHSAGASGQWVMHPVVKATDFELTGSLTMQLQADPNLTLPMVNGAPLTLGDFTAEVTASDATTVQQALTTAGGGVFEAQFPFLAPGSYSVSFVGPAGVSFATTPGTPATVSVASGQTTTGSFTLTSATVTP